MDFEIIKLLTYLLTTTTTTTTTTTKTLVSTHRPCESSQSYNQLEKRLRSSTDNKSVLLGGSRKPYISARKVIELRIETRAVHRMLAVDCQENR